MSEQPTPPKSFTRHVVLTVTAHVVDVYDSHSPGDPDDKVTIKPGTKDEQLAAFWVGSHPCPPCAGVALVEVDGKRAHSVENCLKHLPGKLEELLKVAYDGIMKQAKSWQT